MRLVLLFLLSACGNAGVVLNETKDSGYDLDDDTGTPGDDTGAPDDTGTVDEAKWEDARLVITAPASGDFLPYGEVASFSAVVYDSDGNPTDFDDIEWTSDVDSSWGLLGAALEDDTLDVGTHAITATARLPNGDRLATTVGGVLVQSVYTGVYTGTLSVNIAYDAYAVGCAGAATIVVDEYGETALGDSNCMISLSGYEIDASFLFELEVDEGDVSGVSAADLYITTYDFDTTGSVDEDGHMTGSFSDDIYGYLQVDGELDVTRVSRDVSDY